MGAWRRLAGAGGRGWLLLCLVAVAGCSRPEPIRVGFIGPLTGRVSAVGTAGRDGALLAVEERNADGGLLGRTVELVIADDQGDPGQGVKAASQLIGQGVVAIVGPMTSTVAVEVSKVVGASGIPLVSPTVATDALSGRDDYFFRVVPSVKRMAASLARYLSGRAGCRRAAVLFDLDNAAYTADWAARFREEFEASGGWVWSRGFRSGREGSLFALVDDCLAVSPGCVVTAASALDTALVCQQLDKLGARVVKATAEWGTSQLVFQYGGRSVEGLVGSQVYPAEGGHPRCRLFRDRFRDRFGRSPHFAAASGYEAVNVVLTALGRQKQGEDLKGAIVRVGTFPGLCQAFTFDAFGDVDRATTVVVARDGRFVPEP